jgi:RNA polymerase sigma-70 factor (ECF subfamily)
LDGSDIVQVTLIEAHRDFDQFDSSTHSALQRWLGRLLRNNLADALKRYRDTAMRDIGREIPIDSKIKELAQAEPPQLPSFDSLPERYRRALAKLSLERQTVIQLRHFEDLKFAEIGQRMGKTENAARMLYLRAVEALQSESSNDDPTREYS